MRNILERAFKTFIEAFIATLAITLPSADLSDRAVFNSILAGAIATGISAVLNMALNYIDKKKSGGMKNE